MAGQSSEPRDADQGAPSGPRDAASPRPAWLRNRVLHVVAIICALDWLSKLVFALALGDPGNEESTAVPVARGFYEVIFEAGETLMHLVAIGRAPGLDLVYHHFDSAARAQMALLGGLPYLAILTWVAWRHGRTGHSVTHFLLAALCGAVLANFLEVMVTGKITDFLAFGTSGQDMVVTNLADLLIAVLQPVVVFVLLPLACVRALGKFFLRRAGQGGSPPS